MSHLLNWYRWINILSIDVAFGASVCAAFFLKISTSTIRPVSLVVLGLSVWIIYTIDHLKDVYGLKKTASTNRHRFHQQNFQTLAWLVATASGIVALLVFRIRPQILTLGIVLASLVLVYIIISQYLKFLKEIAGAALYCAGVFLPSLSQAHSVSHFLLTWDCTLFLILVLTNLLVFSWYELDQDMEDSHQSFTVSFGKPTTRIVVVTLLAAASILLLNLWIASPGMKALCFTLMTIGLMLIVVFPTYFWHHDRYRYVGDVIFLFPLLALPG